jgi:8-oxo-dGTP pyrophosphatase MutT (NUDIX family)
VNNLSKTTLFLESVGVLADKMSKTPLFEALDRSKVDVDYELTQKPADRGSVGILPYCPETKRYLLNYRSSTVNDPNVWNCWGGGVDDGETFKQAARRELEEESGYKGETKLRGLYKTRVKGNSPSFEFQMFVADIPKEFEPVINDESDGYKWVTLSEMSSIEPKHWGLSLTIDELKSGNVGRKYTHQN